MAQVIPPGRRPKKRRYIKYVKNSVGFGSILALVLSYVEHGSILWGLFHAFLGWIYVIYFVIMYRILG